MGLVQIASFVTNRGYLEFNRAEPARQIEHRPEANGLKNRSGSRAVAESGNLRRPFLFSGRVGRQSVCMTKEARFRYQ